MKNLRRIRHSFLVVLVSLSTSPFVFAEGNPDLVGVLASISQPEVAETLGLTDSQRSRLSDLIKRAEANALNLGAELRNLPVSERRFKEMEAVRAIEASGLAILNDAQKVQAQQLRLKMLGGLSIFDPAVASQLNISPEQRAMADAVLEGRGALARSMSREAADAEIRKRLAAIFNEDQKSTWKLMSGADIGTPAQESSVDIVGSREGTESEGDSAAFVLSGEGLDPEMAEEGSAQGAEGVGPTTQAMAAIAGGPDGLVLNFAGAPWSDVLKWIAKEAELNLQIDRYPPGTFSNHDPYRRYTVEEAIDLMNFSLLSKGYTLVKKHRILMAIDLSSGESAEVMRSYLRELAELVPPEDLDKRGDYEILKTVFTLHRSSVEEIEREIRLLVGPQGSIVPLASAGQLLVTEMGGKLRIIRETIARAENPEGARSASIVKISLQFVSADEVLAIARNLLGINDNEYRGEDISISTDTFGNTLFATGSVDKLQKLRDIVKQVDIKPEESGVAMSAADLPKVRSHPLNGSDPATTLSVLQTMFAGQPNLNMELDPQTNNIIVRGVATDHETIESIIRELGGRSSDFDIIPLGVLDTNAAVLTLEKFYGKSTTASTSRDAAAKGPIFYGDPAGRRILVKGTPQEVEQIRLLLGKIESSSPQPIGLEDGVRTIPVRGKAADRLLEQLELLNKARRSKIRISIPKGADTHKTPDFSAPELGAPTADAGTDSPRITGAIFKQQPAESLRSIASVLVSSQSAEDSATSNAASPQPAAARADSSIADEASSASPPVRMGGGEIQIHQGPSGLIIASDDPEAMQEFDYLLKMATSQMEAAPAEPTIRFLKHITANAAAELIKNVIAGEQATGGGSLLGDVASNMMGGGGLFGSIFGGSSSSSSNAVSGESTIGNVIITPDARLNAIWIQANPIDALFVEDILEIIDVEESEVGIRTRGQMKIIYLENSSVEDVEPVVKQVFAQQLGQAAAGGGAQGGQRQPSPEDFINMLRGAAGGGGNRRGGGGAAGPSELKEQTMTISADKKNNALIVVGPRYLYEQVAYLVEQMDEAAAKDEETIVTIPLDGDVNPTLIQSTLSSMFGSAARTSTPSSNAPPPTATPGPSNPFNSGSSQRARRNDSGAPSGFGRSGAGFSGSQGGAPGGFQGGFQGGGTRGGGNRGGGFPGGGNRGNQ